MPAGPIALVTHSGSMFSALLRTHRRLEYSSSCRPGARHHHGRLPRLRAVAAGDPRRRPGAGDPPGRARAGRRSPPRPSDVPVVATLTVGSSRRGRSLVDAHSGALAGSDAAWEASSRRTACTGATTSAARRQPGDLRDRAAGPPPGQGIATVHDSGAERVLVADVAERLGVPFAPLAEGTTARLAALPSRGLAPTNRSTSGAPAPGGRPVHRLPDGARRRRRGGRGGAGGRPGAGVRRRRRLPAGTRPAGGSPTSRWSCSRTSPRRSTSRWPPTCGRAASPSSKHPVRAPGTGAPQAQASRRT